MQPRSTALSSAYVKLQRAEKHIADFAAWLSSAVFDDSNYEIVKERSADGGQAVLKVRHRIAAIPNDATATIGDTLHNLRSALDHLACAIALRHNPAANLGAVYFTIAANRNAFESAETQGKLTILGPAGTRFMKGLKP